MRRVGVKGGLIAVAALVVATAWGLSVSVGVGAGVVKRSELPDGGFDGNVGKAETVVSARWGDGEDGLGVSYDGETVGPNSFGVDDRSRVYVLDQVNRRIVRYDGGRVETSFPLPDARFDDLVVARDRFVALSRDGERRALVFDQEAGLIATLPVAPALGAISRLAVVDGDVCVQCPTQSAMDLHAIGDIDGRRYEESRQAVPRPAVTLPDGVTLEAAKVDENHIKVAFVDHKGAEKRRLLVHSVRDISAIVDILTDKHGNVFVVYALYKESASEKTKGCLVIAKYSADGDLLGRVETRDDFTPEPQRKVAVSEDGALYQLVTDRDGAGVLRWALER